MRKRPKAETVILRSVVRTKLLVPIHGNLHSWILTFFRILSTNYVVFQEYFSSPRTVRSYPPPPYTTTQTFGTKSPSFFFPFLSPIDPRTLPDLSPPVALSHSSFFDGGGEKKMGHFYARDRERLFPLYLALGHLLATFSSSSFFLCLGRWERDCFVRRCSRSYLLSLSLSLPFCPFS